LLIREDTKRMKNIYVHMVNFENRMNGIELFLLISGIALTLGVVILMGVLGRQVFRSAWIDSRSIPLFWAVVFILLVFLIISWGAVFFYFKLV